MTSRQVLQELCQRHGLPVTACERLLPLLDRALESPPGVRRRLLRLVDRSLAKRAAEAGSTPARADREALVAVARVLHRWNPAGDLLDIGEKPAGENGDDGSMPS